MKGHSGTANSPLTGPVHVLYLIDELCEMGGAERVLLNTIRLLPQDKFRATLVTFKIDPTLGIQPGCPLHVFPLGKTYNWSALRVARRLRRLIRSEDVRIVHTFFETSDLWGGLVSKLGTGAALVSSRRDMGILRSGKHRWAYRILNPMFDMVLTVSDEVRNFCLRHDRLAPGRVVTVYNGIDLEKLQAGDTLPISREELGVAGASHLIATVAHIRPIKGVDVLLRAAAQVCQEFPAAAFLVVGEAHDPEHFGELRELTRRLKLTENVRFLGGTERVLSLLKACDLFCLPSRDEGFSNALLEAMACSLPCVATRVGGNAEALVDGETGFLVPPEDPQALAERMLALLRDPALRRRMGLAGREVVQTRFTADSMIRQLTSCYDRLLDNKRA